MEKNRILQIGMHDNLGGVENFIMNYYRNIDREKFQFDFINIYDSIYYQEEIKSLGGKIFSIKNVKKHPIKYYKELKKILIENKYEIVHINMLSLANILPIIAAKRAKVPHIIMHSHNGGVPKGILRVILNKINQCIVLRDNNILYFACSELAGKWMFKDQSFKVIDNAIDIEKFKYNEEIRNRIRKKEDVENKLVIGHVGRFQQQKNHEFLIKVFEKIHEERKEAVLMLIGMGELEKKIRTEVEEIGLKEQVKFLGVKNNVNEYYQAMDMFLLPSFFEGFPVVGVEAQASGLLCVMSSNITKEAKIIETAEFLPLTLEPEKWAKHILEAYEKYNRKDKETLDRLDKFDIKIKAKELEELYFKILKGEIIEY